MRRMPFDIVQTRCGVSSSNTRLPEALDEPLTMSCFVDAKSVMQAALRDKTFTYRCIVVLE